MPRFLQHVVHIIPVLLGWVWTDNLGRAGKVTLAISLLPHMANKIAGKVKMK